MSSGRRSHPSYPSLLLGRKEVAPEPMTGWYLKGYSGYSRRELVGKIFLTDILTPQRAGVV